MESELKILVVEDNYEHLRLTKYILKSESVPGEVHVVRDGQEALDYLYQRNSFADKERFPRPDLIMLDLNMPRVDGKEVLKTIKKDSGLMDIPVIVVSSSDREEDIQYARENGAATYISKSSGFENLKQALSTVHTYAKKK